LSFTFEEQKMKTRLLMAISAGLLLLSINTYAHHAFSQEFDVNSPVDLTGIVSKVEMINPHSWIHIDVTDENGATETWMIEGGSPNALFRRGVTKDSFPIGAELIVGGYQARDGSNRAVGRDINHSDGRPIFFRGTATPDRP
jgi:hypothetical protein